MHGIVLYADGGVRPNPGFAGSGIHGYIYDTSVPIKGIGLGSTVATSQGYFPKTEAAELTAAPKKKAKKEEVVADTPVLTEVELLDRCADGIAIVMPIEYYDMSIPIAYTATNNLAELNAAIRGAEFILQRKKDYPDLNCAVINTDSDLTVKGAMEWLPNWYKRDFIKSDGTYVANHQMWKVMYELMRELESQGVQLKLRWVRGHNGEFGNEKADLMATMAVYSAFRKMYAPIATKSPVEGYWKFDSELHPMIQHKCIYFNSGPDYHIPGVYNMGNHGKDDDLLGNRQSDGSYSHVRLTTHEHILEETVAFAKQACNQSDNLWVGYITRLAIPETRQAVTNNGQLSFDPMSEPHVGYRGIGSGKDPLVRMLRPPHLAGRAVKEVSTLSGILDRFITELQNMESGQCDATGSFVIKDVTDRIYDTEEVVDKKGVATKKTIIKPGLPVGMPSIKLPVDYRLIGKTELETRELTFSTGIDMLTRNALKRLETLNPCVYVVTWGESEQSFRYATIVTTDDAIGIWGGVYSNLFLIPKKEKAKV